MSNHHRRALFLALSLAGPAFAQTPPVPNSTAPVPQGPGTDIVVSGGTEKMSDWKRAEADHVVVLSNGSEEQLKRVTNNLERLYQLMSRIYHRADPDETIKLQVTLVDSAASLRAMGLRSMRGDDVSYAAGFAGRLYYDPRDEGDVLVVARTDEVIDLDTEKAHDRDCDDRLGQDDFSNGGDCSSLPMHVPIGRPWEAVLYSAFAQHFLETYIPAAYPRWYLDGVGALFSTVDMRGNGAIDMARAPDNYIQFFRSYGVPNVADVLTGRYLDPAYAKTTPWTPYHAWLLAHYFLFSQLKPERAGQFEQYMTAVHQGTPMAEAAKLFGDMDKLQHEIVVYARNSTEYGHVNAPPAREVDPLVTTLSVSSAAMIAPKIELGARPSPAEGAPDWLAQLRARAAQWPGDDEALLVLAEAECRAGHAADCLADAERVLARAPDNVRALTWKGIALTDQAIAGPAADRAATLDAARVAIRHANHLENRAPLALLAYFESFTKAGEPVPAPAMTGMALLARYVPAAPGPRLDLGAELVRQGQADVARKVLYPVMYGPDDTPEKKAALALFAPGGGASAPKASPAP